MDPVERYNDKIASLRVMLDGFQARIWTAMPGIIDAYDAADNTVTAHVVIQATLTGPNGNTKNVDMPPMYKLPVQWPGGADAILTFPLSAGTECLVVFCARAIDTWWQSGGSQPPLEDRMTDLTDGVCIPILTSVPNVPASISTATTQLRSRDGATYVELDAANKEVNVVSPNDATITAPHVTVHGDLRVTGKVIGLYGTGNDVELDTHLHSNVQSGGSNSGPPVKPS